MLPERYLTLHRVRRTSSWRLEIANSWRPASASTCRERRVIRREADTNHEQVPVGDSRPIPTGAVGRVDDDRAAGCLVRLLGHYGGLGNRAVARPPKAEISSRLGVAKAGWYVQKTPGAGTSPDYS